MKAGESNASLIVDCTWKLCLCGGEKSFLCNIHTQHIIMSWIVCCVPPSPLSLSISLSLALSLYFSLSESLFYRSALACLAFLLPQHDPSASELNLTWLTLRFLSNSVALFHGIRSRNVTVVAVSVCAILFLLVRWRYWCYFAWKWNTSATGFFGVYFRWNWGTCC